MSQVRPDTAGAEGADGSTSPRPAPDVSVVIVSHNTARLLGACISSVFEETMADLEVIVVDNGSDDGSAAMVAERFPAVKLVTLEDNVGFARACNVGVELATGGEIALLNPDTIVLDHAIDRLRSFARRHPEAGIYGGRSVAADGSVQASSCLAAPSLWSLLCFALGVSTVFRRSSLFNPETLGRWPRDSVRHVEVVNGCLLLVSKRLWDELGGFDDRFFMYSEDVDLCLRARGLGCRPVVTPEATVVHELGSSSPSSFAKQIMVLRGRVTFIDKHWGPGVAWLGRTLLVAGVGLRAAAVRCRPRRRPPDGSPWLQVWRARREWRAGWGQPQPG